MIFLFVVLKEVSLIFFGRFEMGRTLAVSLIFFGRFEMGRTLFTFNSKPIFLFDL